MDLSWFFFWQLLSYIFFRNSLQHHKSWCWQSYQSGGENDAIKKKDEVNRSGQFVTKKSGKLRNLQKIMSPLNVVLDTLRQLSSLKHKSRKNQTTLSRKVLKIPPNHRRKKKLVFHQKLKQSHAKPPRLPKSYPNKKHLVQKPTQLSSQKSTEYEAFRNCLLITTFNFF